MTMERAGFGIWINPSICLIWEQEVRQIKKVVQEKLLSALFTGRSHAECVIDPIIICREMKAADYRPASLSGYRPLSCLVHHVPRQQVLSLASQELRPSSQYQREIRPRILAAGQRSMTIRIHLPRIPGSHTGSLVVTS